MKIRILGCGTSGGVPRIDGYWGRCDPDEPKNRRRRVSIMVEEGETRVIVDTSPDLREQMLDARVNRLDAVFFSHDHADHTHGIDDLRGLYQANRRRIDCFGNADTMATLRARFGYAFDGENGYPATCAAHVLGGPVVRGGLHVAPFSQIHGPIESLGFRFTANGRYAAYSTDLIDLPEESYPYVENLDLWIIDALRPEPHPTHLHLERTLDFINHFQPKRAVLTHMNWDMDYRTLSNSLPEHIQPGYDGLEIHL